MKNKCSWLVLNKNQTRITKEMKSEKGATLTELIITTAMVATLGSMGMPPLINQLNRGKQSEAETIIAQLITQVSAFDDEFGKAPESWSDLDEIAKVPMDGGASPAQDFSNITTPSGNYEISTSRSNNKYTFIATSKDNKLSKRNVVGCSNIATGASQIISGNGQVAASASNLKC